jgi:pilus assembly protein CpaE
MAKITVLIVDDIPETRENLRKLLYFEPDLEVVATAANGREAIDQARKLQPNIVLMDINMPDMDGITASQEITRVAPVCQVIMMSVQSEADYLRRSMLAGAMDFLTKPFTSEELSSSIHRVFQMGANRRAAMPAMVAEADQSGVPGWSQALAGRPPARGKLLLVFSPTGGTGCSSVAANLAIALHKVTTRKVALIDLNLQFGAIDAILNLQGNRSLADVLAREDELDGDLLGALMSPHASGIKALAAPPSPEMAERITGEQIKAVLSVMRGEFDYVVADTCSYLDDIVLAAMDVADRLLLVMVPEIPSIKAIKQIFEITEAMEFPPGQIDLVLNKVVPRDDIRAEQLENSLRHPILAQLEFDPRSMRLAINQGLPLMVSQPNLPLSTTFAALAQQVIALLEPKPVAPAEEPAEAARADRTKRVGLFGRLKK